MDSITENRKDPCLIKTHFLQPCVDSDGTVAELPRRRQQSLSLSSSDFQVLSKKISATGFRLANRDFTSWAIKMEALHEPIWRKAGIFEAIKASTYKVPKNPSLILALVEKWCPETKSFVFPWGEATITLEDVTVLLGFSVLGSSVNAPLESLEMREAMAKLERGRVENRRNDGRVGHTQWISSFRNIDDDDDKIEHEAFLTVWLSDFVFPDAWCRSISGNVLPVAVRLARGEKIALAPAVLASLYRDLTRIHGFVKSKSHKKRIKLESLFKLVQVWIWERFRNIRPEEAREIQMGKPRIARWSFKEHKCEKSAERLCFDKFNWRPYAKSLKNWSRPRFYAKEAKWVNVDDIVDDEFLSFARCLRVSWLVGIGFVEDYYPNRVAMQFGFDQDLPGLVTHHSDKTEKEAWDDYDKPLIGLKLYIPSRLARGSVTKRYQDWWLKSVSEFLSSEDDQNETFNAGDDDDASPKVVPLSQVVQKLRKGFHAELKRCKKRRKGKKKGDCGGSTSREVTLSELFHKKIVKRTSEHLRNKRSKRAREEDPDDNITIAEIGKSRKKTEGDASESLVGKRSRLDDEVYVRFDIKKGIGKISDCGGSSTSREMPLSELFQELAKRTNEHLRNKRCNRACEDDDDITIAEMVKSRENAGGDASESLEENYNGSGLCEKLASEDETVAREEIEPMIEVNDEEEETRIETENITVLVSSDEINSLHPPLGSNGRIVETVASPQETRKNCDGEADVNGSNTEKKTMIDDGTNEEEYLIHKNGENQRENLCSEVKKEEEEIHERLKQRKLNIEETFTVMIPSDENNSSGHPLAASYGGIVGTVVSPQETRQKCDDEVDVNGSTTEKKTMINVGTKEEEYLMHENGEKQREKLCSEAKKEEEEEEIDERLKQRKLKIEEIALKLGTRMAKTEKSLAMIRDWKTRRNQIQTRVSD